VDKLEAFRVFAAVARHRGFAAAGRELGMSPPATTRAIAGLERHLGVALFHRTSRVVTLTEEGAALLERVRDILSLVRDAEHQVMGRRSEPGGELHVTAPVMYGRLHVLPVLANLLSRHPGMTARLMLLDRNVRLAEEGVDVAVRIGELEDSSLIATGIGSVRQTIVASPGYLARRGVPRTPDDLAGHDAIVADGARDGSRWRFGEAGRETREVRPRITLNSLDAVIAAACDGLGLANVLSYQAAEHVATGELVAVLEEHAPPALPVHLLYPANRASLPTVRLFLDAMRRRRATGRADQSARQGSMR
jgi:DNA-binding transcriptional LysR family regulator